MPKLSWNRPEIYWEIYVFVWQLQADFDQNRLNVKKFAKNEILKQTAQKDQYRCKITRYPKWLIKISKCWYFNPNNPLTFAQLGRTTLRLFRLSKNGAAFSAHLVIHLFHTCCENFRPGLRKARSPGHVKWPHKKFECSSTLHRLNDRLETFSDCYKQEYL